MKSWRSYRKRLLANWSCPDLTLMEKTLVLVVLSMLVINSISLLNTAEVGSLDQIRLAKLQAEQELMALK
jgi:hypothetical protein